MGLYGKKYKVDDVSVRAFLALASAGMWGDKQPLDWRSVDWDDVFQLAKEQALVGIVSSAFDPVPSGQDLGFELQEVLSRDQRKALAKKVYSIEQRNLKMNLFIAKLFKMLENHNLHPVLHKGQGLAYDYPNPLRRSPGDVDILLQPDEYAKARDLLLPKASKIIDDGNEGSHASFFFSGNIVELHESLHISLKKSIDQEIDRLLEEMFKQKSFRTLDFEAFDINLPAVNYDVVFVFCHILQHLFTGGIGLRQVYDLSRILHVYRDEIDRGFLETELKRLGLMDEWNAFATLMVNYLGAPAEDIPFFPVHTSACNNSTKWNRKAKKILSYILSTGNMGKNRDLSYRKKSPYLIKKTVTLWFIISNAVRLGSIFPKDTAMISFKGLASGLKDLAEHK
ncbi:MAG: nucleotidyltransferase family protein [Bacteroidales bacterium]|nr:nucleotidyltransferase family protein [Bacteroidales bacterium]